MGSPPARMLIGKSEQLLEPAVSKCVASPSVTYPRCGIGAVRARPGPPSNGWNGRVGVDVKENGDAASMCGHSCSEVSEPPANGVEARAAAIVAIGDGCGSGRLLAESTGAVSGGWKNGSGDDGVIVDAVGCSWHCTRCLRVPSCPAAERTRRGRGEDDRKFAQRTANGFQLPERSQDDESAQVCELP